MAIHGYTWYYMAIRGNTWQYMVIHSNTWLFGFTQRDNVARCLAFNASFM